MTFSEYIKQVAWIEYQNYCRQHNIIPVKDIQIPTTTKLPRLLDKNA